MAPNNSFDQVPKGTWQDLVQFAQRHGSNVTVEQFKDRYDSAVENFRREPSYKPVLTRPRNEPQPDENGCLDFGPYEVGFGGIATAGVQGKFCGGDDWSLSANAYIKVLGFQVWSASISISAANPSVTFDIDLKVVKGQISVGIVQDGDRYCLRITGKISVWIPFSWHDFNVDWEPVCF